MKGNLFSAIRNTLALLLIQFVCLAGLVLTNFGHEHSARAETLTPEASSYTVDKNTDPVNPGVKRAEDQLENTTKAAKNAVEEASEDVTKKLNLDEPIPEDTKKFFRQIQGKEPIVNERRPQLNQ